MRNVIYLCIFLNLTIFLNAQIETELLFDFQLSNDEEIVDIKLFDFNNNGNEEIFILTSNGSEIYLYIFDQNGSLNSSYLIYQTYYWGDSSIHLFSFNNSNYISILTKDFININIVVYNSMFGLILNQTYSYFSYSWPEELSLTSEIINQQLYLIAGFMLYSSTEQPGAPDVEEWWGASMIFQFDGYSLNYLNWTFPFYGYLKYSNLALSYNRNSQGSPAWGYERLLNIIISPESVLIDTLYNWDYPYPSPQFNGPTVQFIGSDDITNINYGTIYMKENTMTCLASITHEVSWFSDYSHFGSSWDITTSANATFIEDDKYLIYFDEDKCEVRDRTNGDIVHFETCNIAPYRLLRNQDGEILVVTQNDNFYQIYKITSINFQVSISNYVISDPQDKIINYPNPFNPSTTIEFSIQNDSNVELGIYNIKGQKIKTIASDAYSKGDHSIIWNGDDENNKPVASGIYYYKLNVNGKTEVVNKCLLLK